jgi:lipopolysaccharide transport system ATP-binding protein
VSDTAPAPLHGARRHPAIRAESLGKLYRLYAQPQDRLRELVLGRRFSRDFWALRDVSFDLMPGERLGVIGRNGSGKSTLLQMLAGTLTPTTGTLTVQGRVAALLELGSGFNPEYTGRENIFLNASILGMTRDETAARFDEIVAFADIAQFIDQPVKTYSSGMFVRLAFAVATSVDADVLLIDEALAVGDVFFAQKCYRRLEQLVDRGVSIVFVSHDTTAVGQFCTTVLVLDEGKPVFLGDPVVGIRTYFSLRRPRAAVDGPEPDANADEEPSTFGMPFPWPSADAFLPLDGITYIGSGARCTAVALCDERRRPCREFEMGQTALFYFELTLDEDIAGPVAGLEIFNERHLVVHGKNTLQFELPIPRRAVRGSRLRFRRQVRLDLAPGRYTFAIGFASIEPSAIPQASEMSYAMLDEHCHPIIVASQAGAFDVSMRTTGHSLTHHGLCDLPGDMDGLLLGSADQREESGSA